MALECDAGDARKAAIRNPNLADEDFLAGIADNDDDYWIRTEAVRKLKSQDILKDLAINANHSEIRSHACKIIEDGDTLKWVIDNDESEEVIASAVENPNFNDKQMLAEFVKHSPYWIVREGAARNVHMDDSTLYEIITDDSFTNNVRQSAISGIKDERLAIEIFYDDSLRIFQDAAVRKIYNQNVLKHIYENSSGNIRRIAVLNSSDVEFLRKVSENDPDVHIRHEASKKLDNLNILY